MTLLSQLLVQYQAEALAVAHACSSFSPVLPLCQPTGNSPAQLSLLPWATLVSSCLTTGHVSGAAGFQPATEFCSIVNSPNKQLHYNGGWRVQRGDRRLGCHAEWKGDSSLSRLVLTGPAVPPGSLIACAATQSWPCLVSH